jgi:O-antigen ligase
MRPSLSSPRPTGRPGPTTPSRAAEAAALGAIGLLAVALGWIVVRYDGFDAGIGLAIGLTAAGIACVAVVLAGPIACLAAIAALTVGGIQPRLAEVGGVEVTLVDVFYVGLVGWWLLGVIGRAQAPEPEARPRIAFGQMIALALFIYVGLTFLHVAASNPDALFESVVSWLRLAATLSIAFLAASVIDSKRDVRIVLGAIAVAGVGAVAFAAVDADGLLGDRVGGALGPNALGLVSGLLLVIAAFGAVTKNPAFRTVLVVAGIAGLLLAKSVASLVAVGLALALGASLAGRSGAAQRVARPVLALVLAGVVVFGVVQLVRPEVTPGSAGFRTSSANQRILLGAAGLEIFERNPVIGAGWRQSSDPALIGDREIVAEVRRRFPDAPELFYPDVSPSSVHNTYVQILADLGLVGFGLFAGLIVAIGLGAWRLLAAMDRAAELRPEAWALSLSLLLLLVWLNDNPLFGGQVETTLAALLVGTLAAVSRLDTRAPAPVAQ